VEVAPSRDLGSQGSIKRGSDGHDDESLPITWVITLTRATVEGYCEGVNRQPSPARATRVEPASAWTTRVVPPARRCELSSAHMSAGRERC